MTLLVLPQAYRLDMTLSVLPPADDPACRALARRDMPDIS
jgi:hypothetical protein